MFLSFRDGVSPVDATGPLRKVEWQWGNETQSQLRRGTMPPHARHARVGGAPELAAPRPPPLIHARGLTKRFGEFTAVDAIDFDVAPGESFGFLGPNGAGKTSTMRMIGCVSPMTGGTLRVLGLDPTRTARASAPGSASCPSRTRSTPS